MPVSKEVIDAYHQKIAEFTALFLVLEEKDISDSLPEVAPLRAAGQNFLNAIQNQMGDNPQLLDDEEVAAVVIVLTLFIESMQNPDNPDAMSDLADIAQQLTSLGAD